MTVIVFKDGGIVHTHTDVSGIATERSWGDTPELHILGHDHEPIAVYGPGGSWLKVEILP